jgi:hypothetical protein
VLDPGDAHLPDASEALRQLVMQAIRRPPSAWRSKVLVIYYFNKRDRNRFFVARGVPIHNKGIIFVSNALIIEFQKAYSIPLGVGGGSVTVKAATR